MNSIRSQMQIHFIHFSLKMRSISKVIYIKNVETTYYEVYSEFNLLILCPANWIIKFYLNPV